MSNAEVFTFIIQSSLFDIQYFLRSIIAFPYSKSLHSVHNPLRSFVFLLIYEHKTYSSERVGPIAGT
jgi:hypothetical protein